MNHADLQLTLMLQVFYLPWLVDFAGPNYGLILELDRNGRITRSFHDPAGSVVPGHISEVYDDGGRRGSRILKWGVNFCNNVLEPINI